MIQVIKVKTATIASGASLSGFVEIDEALYIGIEMPAAWDAANLTFQVSRNGSDWLDLYDDAGNEVTVTASSGTSIGIKSSADAFKPWQYVKIRSGTSALPVNQTAARTLYVCVKY